MIPKHTNRISVLYFLQTLYLFADMKDNDMCVQEKNTTICCPNYRYNVSVKKCVECVGRFGYNCSEQCPDGLYGRSCNSKCNCPIEACNKISGCLTSSLDVKNGICYDKQNGAYCCVNYEYLKNKHKCQECVGRFGVNCSQKCPEGYYGKQCNEKCTCNASQCHEILGCLTVPSEFKRNQQSVSAYILQFVVPASTATGALLLCVLLGFRYRSKKKRNTEIQTSVTATINMEREECSASTSVAVKRPKKKRMNSILQHSTTYDNKMFLEKTNHENTDLRCSNSRYKGRNGMGDLDAVYSMCAGYENIYDDTVCLASSLAQSIERIPSSEIEY
ncbi:multiple epidermal growth factor-like domains protein 10 [Ostrea edulis]|uniref:multiple epidermal growth factor-like domains protein 10 n=1 Tax=Ostrea edulis TaxID=37623 RepID=UPI0024AF319C|nr:multiple epidermal growth factor-like domains protein 10 [Ostrea edulis]